MRHALSQDPPHPADLSNVKPVAWRPIHYLGSKLRVIEKLGEVISALAGSGGRVCDLFAGSGTVAAYLAQRGPVTAADVQEYSRAICAAVLGEFGLPTKRAIFTPNEIAASECYRQLRWVVEPVLPTEESGLSAAERGDIAPMAALMSDFGTSPQIIEYRNRIAQLRDAVPAVGIIEALGGRYYSYAQAADLAALRQYADTCALPDRAALIAATLATASSLVNSIGKQFAQPLKLIDASGKPKNHLAKRVWLDRHKDVLQSFYREIEKFVHRPVIASGSRAIVGDFRDVLTYHSNDCNVIYADPPYTRDHYSRFYHGLETIARMDQFVMTTPTSVARYRADRHQSPFCIKSQAPQAFNDLFSGARHLGAPIVVSYSPTPPTARPRERVMTVEQILDIAKRHYRSVSITSIENIAHSKLNKKSNNTPSTRGAEIVLVAERPT